MMEIITNVINDINTAYGFCVGSVFSLIVYIGTAEIIKARRKKKMGEHQMKEDGTPVLSEKEKKQLKKVIDKSNKVLERLEKVEEKAVNKEKLVVAIMDTTEIVSIDNEETGKPHTKDTLMKLEISELIEIFKEVIGEFEKVV